MLVHNLKVHLFTFLAQSFNDLEKADKDKIQSFLKKIPFKKLLNFCANNYLGLSSNKRGIIKIRK